MRMVTPPLERGFTSPMVKPGAICGVLPMMCHIQCNIPSVYVKGKDSKGESYFGRVSRNPGLTHIPENHEPQTTKDHEEPRSQTVQSDYSVRPFCQTVQSEFDAPNHSRQAGLSHIPENHEPCPDDKRAADELQPEPFLGKDPSSVE